MVDQHGPDAGESDLRLSQLVTQWTVVLGACRGTGDASRTQQALVLERYCGAIYRYALGALGDADLAAETCQEFALRFLREVSRAAMTDDPDQLAEELANLDLLTYCREALKRLHRA